MAKQALGIIEAKGLTSLIEASDAAIKAADVTMTGWDKIGSGLVCGFFTGDVAAHLVDHQMDHGLVLLEVGAQRGQAARREEEGQGS